jgi:hypothetical protein
MFQQDDRVRVIASDQIAVGSIGTVTSVDEYGTVHVQFEDGPLLGMVPGKDVIDVLRNADEVKE